MVEMVGTTRQAVNRLRILESSLDPIRTDLLVGYTSFFMDNETGLGVTTLWDSAIPYTLAETEYPYEFAKVNAEARRDAVYSYMLTGLCRIPGESGLPTRRADESESSSTSDLCDLALEALCDVEPGAALEIGQRGIAADIRTAVWLAEATFPRLNGIRLGVDQDPEIPERRTIRMTLRVSGEPDTVLKEERQFKKQLYKILDNTAREMLTLTYEWAG